MNKIVFNSCCFFGTGAVNEISKEIENRHLTKGFIITDSGLIEAGIYQKIANIFMTSKIPSVLFSDISNEPTANDIKNAYAELKRSKADFILAVGGGSAIDTAKAISVIITNPKFEDVLSLKGRRDNINAPLPVFAVPTTAGSAAEASKSFVITDEFSRKKLICFSDKALPVAVFIDPELMITMPDIVTLSSGLDALAHATESLICKRANMLSTTLAKEAVRLVFQNLPQSYDEPEDINARQNMAYAEYIAGVAYTNSGLGLCHSIAHAVAGRYTIPHGVALAIALPSVLKYNMYSSASENYKFLAEALQINTAGMKKEEICRAVLKKYESFLNDFNMPKKYSEYGVQEEDLNSIALEAFEDACTETNPRETTVSDIYLILKKLM